MRFAITAITLFLAATLGYAQSVSRVVEGSQFPGALAVRNFVLNPGCEKNVNNITASAGSLTQTTSAPVEGAGSCAIDAAASGNTYTWALQAFENTHINQQCYYRFCYTGNAALYDAEIRLNGASLAAQTLADASSTTQCPMATWACGDLSQATTFRLRATGNGAAIKVDQVYVGTVPPGFLQTTKGDLVGIGTSGVPSRLAVGTDAQVLLADSSTTTGLAWGANGGTASDEITNIGLAVGVGSSAATISLKQSDGSTNCSTGTAACKIGFRNVTAATGGYLQRSVTGSLSTVISAGSTAGMASTIVSPLYIYGIDNAGTVELAWSSALYDNGSVKTTTAEGGAGAADSYDVIYSTTARTSVPIRLLGRVSIANTSGNWTSTPTEISVWPFEKGTASVKFIAASAGGQTISDTVINNWTASTDTHSALSSTTTWTTPISGYYHLDACYSVDVPSSQPQVGNWAKIFVDGVELARGNTYSAALTYAATVSIGSCVHRLLKLDKGNAVTIKVEQNSGASRTGTGSGAYNWWTITGMQ